MMALVVAVLVLMLIFANDDVGDNGGDDDVPERPARLLHLPIVYM